MKQFTDKNKKQFKQWLYNYASDYYGGLELQDKFVFHFNEQPPEMQKGVIEAYYDSLGVQIDPAVRQNETGYILWAYRVYKWPAMVKGYSKYFDTRMEAFEAALTEANKLINKTL